MKKKMCFGKRLVTGLLLTSLVLGVTACGKSDDAGATDQQPASPETTEETTQEDDAAQGGEETTEDSGVSIDDTVSIDEIYQAVKDAYGESYLPNMMLSGDEIMANYSISEDWYTEAIAEMPMINVQIDTFIAIKATDDHIADVTSAVIAYQDYLKADTMQYPSNMNKIQASTVVTLDNYIFFIMLGTITPDEEIADDAVQVEAYAAQNQIAVDAIESVLLK